MEYKIIYKIKINYNLEDIFFCFGFSIFFYGNEKKVFQLLTSALANILFPLYYLLLKEFQLQDTLLKIN